MKKEAISSDYFNFKRLWKFFASVKLTVAVLSLLAATSIIGTVIPQNKSSAAYLQAYGEFCYTIFSFLDVFDMYHSWWFQLLLILLTVNIIVCSIERISIPWKIVFVKIPSFNVTRFRKLSQRKEFTSRLSPDQLKKLYEPAIPKSFGYIRIEETADGFCFFAEKGRWTRFGPYIVHVSVILLLLGSLIGSLAGFEGYTDIPEGETRSSIRIKNTDNIHHLDFGIRCDDFNVSFYDNGAPKEFRSSLTIIENGKPVLKKDIIVNDPLRYKGINIFQSRYGKLPPSKISPKKSFSKKDPSDMIILNIISKETGINYQETTVIGRSIELPEGVGKFVIKDFMDSADFKGMKIGEVYLGVLTPVDGSPVEVLLPLRFPNFDKMRNGNMAISIVSQSGNRGHFLNSGEETRYYTYLQVTKDPGVPVVYTGFIIMIIGCFITFFMSHQRICIEVTENDNKSKIMVSGTNNKSSMGIENRLNKISRCLTGLEQRGLF